MVEGESEQERHIQQNNCTGPYRFLKFLSMPILSKPPTLNIKDKETDYKKKHFNL